MHDSAFDFTGYRVLVAGGSKGIGRSIALGFAQAGAAVSICARGEQALEATRQELAALGHATHAARCDLSDAQDIINYVASAAESLWSAAANWRGADWWVGAGFSGGIP